MPLPANDVFSFGLAHDEPRTSPTLSRTRTRSRSQSRGPISFSTSAAAVSSRPAAAHRTISTSSSSSVGTSTARREGAHIGAGPRKSSGGVMTIRRHKREDSARGAHSVNGANGVNGQANGHIANGDGHGMEARTNGVADGKTDKEVAKEKVVVDWEIPRKALHSSIGFFTIYLYTSNGSPQKVVVALSAALAVLIPIDILRLNVPAAERMFEKCVGIFMRESEKKSSNGVIWYLLGADLCLIALPLDVAVVSIIILSWADTAASTIGRLWGRYTKALPQRTPVLRLPLAARKSRAGFAAACVTGGVIAVGFWGWLAPASGRLGASWTWENGVGEYFRDQAGAAVGEKVRGVLGGGVSTGGWLGLLVIGVVAGLVSGVAEALDLGTWDDNLTLPVIAGSCLWIFYKVLGFIAS